MAPLDYFLNNEMIICRITQSYYTIKTWKIKKKFILNFKISIDKLKTERYYKTNLKD